MQGTIKKIITHRGFGFIEVKDQDDDIFFHRTSVKGSTDFDYLETGQTVEFELEDTPKGPQAIDVTTS